MKFKVGEKMYSLTELIDNCEFYDEYGIEGVTYFVFKSENYLITYSENRGSLKDYLTRTVIVRFTDNDLEQIKKMIDKKYPELFL